MDKISFANVAITYVLDYWYVEENLYLIMFLEYIDRN